MKETHATESPYKVLLRPIVTEKSTTLAEGTDPVGVAYAFKVAPSATKPQIRHAIETIFNVKVASVRVANHKGKPRRMRFRSGGMKTGRRPGSRRAYVSLKEGHEIDFWKLTSGGAP